MKLQPRSQRDMPWWQQCSVEDFRRHIKRLSESEIESLLAEINGAIAMTNGVASDTSKDPDWRRRARSALSFQVEKRSILIAYKSELEGCARIRQKTERQALIDRAKILMAEGDDRGALLLVLDWIDGFGRRGSEI
ncbi:MAG: hypothetical protein KF764_31515 [Labilithrix sp.]|nr:hypothetical protein [Labilithrix sp.]